MKENGRRLGPDHLEPLSFDAPPKPERPSLGRWIVGGFIGGALIGAVYISLQVGDDLNNTQAPPQAAKPPQKPIAPAPVPVTKPPQRTIDLKGVIGPEAGSAQPGLAAPPATSNHPVLATQAGPAQTALRSEPATTPSTPLRPTATASTALPASAGHTRAQAPQAAASVSPPPLKNAPTTPQKTNSASGDWIAQVGAADVEANADAELKKIFAKMAGASNGYRHRLQKTEGGGKVFYREQVTGFSDKKSAADFCLALRALEGACLVKKGD